MNMMGGPPRVERGDCRDLRERGARSLFHPDFKKVALLDSFIAFLDDTTEKILLESWQVQQIIEKNDKIEFSHNIRYPQPRSYPFFSPISQSRASEILKNSPEK